MTMRGLMRGTLLYAVGNFLPRFGLLLLLPVYTFAMGPEQYGTFALMTALAGLLAIVFRLGLDGALLRLHFALGEERRPALYWTVGSLTVAAIAIGAGLLVLLVAPVFDRIFAGVAFAPYGILALALAAGTALHPLATNQFRATEQAGRFVAFAIAVFAVGAVVTIWLVVGLGLGAAGGLLGQVAGAAMGVAVAAALVFRMRPLAVEGEIARSGLRFGLPLVPHALGGWVLNLSDRILLGVALGVSALAAQAAIGVYALGYQLGQVVSMAALSFNTAWVPFFYVRGDQPQGPQLLARTTTLSIAGLAVIATAVAALAPELVAVLAPERWGASAAGAAGVAAVVAFASLPYGLYFMLVSVVFLHGRTLVLPAITLSSAGLNVVANLLLIPRFGILGAALATVIGYSALAAATFALVRRTYALRLDWRRLGLAVGGALAAISLAWAWPASDGLTRGIAHAGVALAFGVAMVLMVRRPARELRDLVVVG